MPVNRAEWTHPDLQTLVALFFETSDELGSFKEVQPARIPQPYRRLLAHTNHMTVSVEDYHGCQVDVAVLGRNVTPTHYSRKIVLKRKSDGKVVQFGIVRLTTAFLAPDVRSVIESETVPLGRVLIDHNVLRTVKLMSLWQIQPGAQLRDAFGDPNLQTCYGRTALIYTAGVPAVELLEIVANL